MDHALPHHPGHADADGHLSAQTGHARTAALATFGHALTSLAQGVSLGLLHEPWLLGHVHVAPALGHLLINLELISHRLPLGPRDHVPGFAQLFFLVRRQTDLELDDLDHRQTDLGEAARRVLNEALL